MAKKINALTYDASFDHTATATQMHLCSSEPADRAAALTAALASVTVAPGDFTKAAGDTSGRKQTVAAKSGVSVTTTGTGTHVVLTSDTELLDVTTCTSQAVTSGNTVNFPAWKREIQAPA